MATRVVAIVNPIAGASRHHPHLARLHEALRAAGIAVERLTSVGPGQARELAAELARDYRGCGRTAGDELRAVIAVGGDGTVHEVADGLAGSGLPLIVWPKGTENLLAKLVGFRADAETTLACIRRGRLLALDVGVANGRSFLTVAGIGFDAEVVHRLVRLRKGHITHLTYLGPLWRTFWEHRFPYCRVTSEGRLVWEGRGLIFVGNGPRYSLGLRVVRDARPDDGLLDLCIFPCTGRLQLVGHSLRTLVRRHLEHGGVRYTRLGHIRIESPELVPVQLDGEAAGFLPLEVTIRPGALHLLVPPGSSHCHYRGHRVANDGVHAHEHEPEWSCRVG